ncbi:MAG: HAMP domain-containing histidine kinase [Thermogemmatispora sp.]|uniref:sensor histidine kinase n=1 Tax=Thermogemmatispora sp. TaxID=1968838 RepID=UPI002619E220|nr:HAMP domain-containing sensor histidine kinase [Thermogemmatispora sp.]MBX5459272.1 HAMP domain-containing histidine kinase [Thermogemmatispora sp.]
MTMLRTCLRLLCGVLVTIGLLNLASLMLLPRLLGSSNAMIYSSLVLATAQIFIVGCAFLKISSEVRHIDQEGRQLRQQNEQLIEDQKNREQLLLILNHEVRTPLAAIKGYAELLRCYREQITAELCDQYLQQINHACDEATFILDSIILPQRAGEQNGAERLDLKEAVLSVLASFAPRLEFEQRTLELQLSKCDVIAQPLQLRQVLRNLVNNALSYSNPGSRLRITLTATRPASAPLLTDADDRQERRIYLAIQDEGVGIPPRGAATTLSAVSASGERSAPGAPGERSWPLSQQTTA